MKSKATKLCDLSQISVAPELYSRDADEAEVEARLAALALEYAEETTAETVQNGDCVTCRAESGPLAARSVLLYPGRSLPGAEAAEAAILGKKPGERVTAAIAGAETALTIQKILRHQPAVVNDALIRRLCMDGVHTVSDYRAALLQEQEESKRRFAIQQISFALLQGLVAHSSYEIDQAEMDGWTRERAARLFREMLDAGEDPRLPEEGFEILTDEQAIDKLAKELESDFRQLLIGRAFCEQAGIRITEEEVRSQKEQLRAAGLGDQMDEEQILENLYMTKLWVFLDDYAEKWWEV